MRTRSKQENNMILSALLSLAAPLSIPQHGQDYVLRDTIDLSSDVITVRQDPIAGFPSGFATLEMTLDEQGEGNYDLLLMRMDNHSNVLWKHQFGGPHDEFSQNIVETLDGGIVVCAYSSSTLPGSNAVLVKFDSAGHLMWSRAYPGNLFGPLTGAFVTELANGNLVLVSSVEGLGVPGAIDAAQTVTDPNGNPIHTWRHDLTMGNNFPVQLTYKSVTSRGNTAVACGSITYNDPISGLQVNSFIQRLPNTIPVDPSAWFNEYQVSVLSDGATGIEWTATDTLVISGARGEFFTPPSQGFSLRVKAGDGSPAGLAVRYEGLVLTDVVEEIDPVTNPNEGPLCFSGYLMRDCAPAECTGSDAVLMKTDPDGVPSQNYLYDPNPWGVLVSVTPYFEAEGYTHNGYFALGTSFSIDYVAPTHQHWVNTDPDLKSGCLEEAYDQPFDTLDIAPIHVPYASFAIDGSMNLNWLPLDPDLQVIDLCEEDDGSIVATCFGDGSGTQCPCGNTGGAGEGCANSTGLGAILSGTGTPSVTADTLVLSVTQGKPSQPILFFQGINFINSGNGNVFGDGLRCCGGDVKRLEVSTMDASGSVSTTATLSVRGSVSAGSTYCNQGWYRDPSGAGGSPCSTFFNLTNGLSVTWAP
jgi:hypothetical protein